MESNCFWFNCKVIVLLSSVLSLWLSCLSNLEWVVNRVLRFLCSFGVICLLGCWVSRLFRYCCGVVSLLCFWFSLNWLRCRLVILLVRFWLVLILGSVCFCL